MLHTYHGLVHKAIWTIAYHTKRYMIPLGTSCSFVCWSILDQPCIFSSLFNRWCLEDNHEWPHNSFLQDMLAIYSTWWSWCQILHYINIFMASTLNPTYGVQAWSMDKHYKYNSMQPLVHRDCHYLPKPHMGAPCPFTQWPKKGKRSNPNKNSKLVINAM